MRLGLLSGLLLGFGLALEIDVTAMNARALVNPPREMEYGIINLQTWPKPSVTFY